MDTEFRVTAAQPHRFSDKERSSFRSLVEQGGEVAPNSVSTNINTARALVFGMVAGELVGIAALKRPQERYRKRIGASAGVDLSQTAYPYELGYVFLLPQARGQKNSPRLVTAALEHAVSAAVFATVRADNERMLATLARAGFEQAGQDYPGREARLIRLLVRPAGPPPVRRTDVDRT